MQVPIRNPSVTESVILFRRIVVFLTDPPDQIQTRFDRLISDIDAGLLRPDYVADVLCSLIRDSLLHVSKRVGEEDFRRFTHDVVTSIDRVFGDLLTVAKNTQTYASDLTEVWIACEPMLDLVPEPAGFLDTLARVVSSRPVRYTYFLSDLRYYRALQSLLAKRHASDDCLARINAVQIAKPYQPPVALYFQRTRVSGFRGKYRPRLSETPDGQFQLVMPLEPDWATDLDTRAVRRHYQALKEFTENNKGA